MDNEKLKASADRLGVSVEVYKFLRESNRKMRYMSKDLKSESIVITGDTIIIIPSREDSYDRLRDLGIEFADEEQSVEEIVIELEQKALLHEALGELTYSERRLIDEIYFSNDGDVKSERTAAIALGIPRSTLNSRKKSILEKLKEIMEKKK